MKLNGKHIAAIILCVIVAVSVYSLPKKAPKTYTAAMPAGKAADTTFSIDEFKNESKNALDSASLTMINKWETAADTGSFRKLSGFWASVNNAGLSAYYTEKLSKIATTSENWYNTSYRYLVASRTAQKDGEKIFFTRKAIEGFTKVISIDPSNLEAKANLGVCYVEGSQILGAAPMKGVELLKEVIEKDPQNITALINLGYFAIQSGQYEKAIERFNQVLNFMPEYLDAYIYLADTYQRMGKKNEAIKMLEILKTKNKNSEVEANVDEFIRDLKASS